VQSSLAVNDRDADNAVGHPQPLLLLLLLAMMMMMMMMSCED